MGQKKRKRAKVKACLANYIQTFVVRSHSLRLGCGGCLGGTRVPGRPVVLQRKTYEKTYLHIHAPPFPRPRQSSPVTAVQIARPLVTTVIVALVTHRGPIEYKLRAVCRLPLPWLGLNAAHCALPSAERPASGCCDCLRLVLRLHAKLTPFVERAQGEREEDGGRIDERYEKRIWILFPAAERLQIRANVPEASRAHRGRSAARQRAAGMWRACGRGGRGGCGVHTSQ
jgi:hypothetical protein